MDIERHNKPMREISLVPLINVVFLLLIFFLVAGTIEKVDMIPVDLPVAASGQILDEGHIQIILGRYGEVILNDNPIQLSDLPIMLFDELEHNKDRVISIKTDSRMDANRLIAVMDHIKSVGGVHISLITQSD
ncbi:MAG: biopolymer transporter ExbD [Rickettsiales bacterium]|nr:biopolymer transporter ExbD [Rickettsiales bacterium]